MTNRLGVFGGTFDPIHVGHLMIAEALADELSLDNVLLVPAGAPPHKPSNPVSPAAHRLRMTELAAIGNPRFQVSMLDLHSSKPSFTVDLLARVQAAYPNASLYFLMGADSLRDLPTWNDADGIARLAYLAVAQRPGVQLDVNSLLDLLPSLRGRILLCDAPTLDISATTLRARVAARKSIRYMTPEPVRQYILDVGLYANNSVLPPTPSR